MLKTAITRPTHTPVSCSPPVQLHAADGNSNDADREMPASNLQNDDKFIHDIERQSEEVCAPVVLHKVTDTNRLHIKHNRWHTISNNQS
jgi:Ni/Co efflux regulator RcnB